MAKSLPDAIDRYRFEAFGGILSATDPPFLAWVDRDFMRNLGLDGGDLWTRPDPGHISAPTEVHFAITRQCAMGCEGCYMGAGDASPGELTTEAIKRHLRTLRDLGVFHVALGGGEAFERPDFREIVLFCRDIGLVPNLTTHGHHGDAEAIETCRLLGQVNVSLDGVGEDYSLNGRRGNFEQVHATLKAMRKAGLAPGINCVVSRKNIHALDRVIAYADDMGLSEIEFLKYKPAGRGEPRYAQYALTQAMLRSFYPWLVEAARKTKVILKMDCSFIPAMVMHHPPLEDMEKLGVTGCDGGNMLMGIKSDGAFSACSFVDNPYDETVADIAGAWHTSEHLNAFRHWTREAPEPCASCDYLTICRGGCRAVALALTGDFNRPDPECPKVWDARHD